MSLTKDLRQWRKDRNITQHNTNVYVANVIEELLEIYFEDKKDIKQFQSEIMGVYFTDVLPVSELNTLDAIQDIQVFSVNETELMGYDNKHCNQEVFKEINSRVQDPTQKEAWLKSKPFGKWEKDKKQSVNTLYKAQYAK